MMREIIQSQFESIAGIGLDDTTEFFKKFRLAIRSQTHHFVFVAKFPEAHVLRQRGVIHPQRVRKRN